MPMPNRAHGNGGLTGAAASRRTASITLLANPEEGSRASSEARIRSSSSLVMTVPLRQRSPRQPDAGSRTGASAAREHGAAALSPYLPEYPGHERSRRG